MSETPEVDVVPVGVDPVDEDAPEVEEGYSDPSEHEPSEQVADETEGPSYAEVDKAQAEADGWSVDDERAKARQAGDAAAAAAANEVADVVQYRVSFDAAAIPVVVDSTSLGRAEKLARQFLRDLADSEDVSVSRLDGADEAPSE